jgi:cysteinyl-tRNA synthetase
MTRVHARRGPAAKGPISAESASHEGFLDVVRRACRCLPALAAAAAATCTGVAPERGPVDLGICSVAAVRTWAIQLQGLERDAAVRAIETASVDMVVIEPMRSMRDATAFPTRDVVRRIQKRPGSSLPQKRCLAYLNIGQAEDYRSYWAADWRAPAAGRRGEPDFLLGLDPDGWTGNYQVAYWDPRWQRCLFGSPDALLDQIIDDGFDGVYLDWVLGFADPGVAAAARAAGIDPAAAMVGLLRQLRAWAHARDPLFVLVAQNGVTLAEQDPAMLRAVDALAQEDLSFRGQATARWFDVDAGDIPAPAEGECSTARLVERLAAVRARGLPVFTLDYALQPQNVAQARATSERHGFVPCVSRTPLDRLPFAAGIEPGRPAH